MGQKTKWSDAEQEQLLKLMKKEPPLTVKGWERIRDKLNKWNVEKKNEERPLTGIRKVRGMLVGVGLGWRYVVYA